MKAKFFCTISVGKNCRDGSNTLLLTDQQEYQILGIVVMIASHDIFKIMDFILFPLQIIVFFTDYSSRLQIIVPDSVTSGIPSIYPDVPHT